ncbi:hypothetical protein ACFQ1I_09755 [Kitasatospora arboriphila]
MTMSSDPPPPPELPPQDAPSASAAPGPTPEPGTPGRPPWYRRRAVRLAALGTALLVAGCTAAGWAAYQRLERNIRTDDATARALDRHAGDRPGQLVAAPRTSSSWGPTGSRAPTASAPTPCCCCTSPRTAGGRPWSASRAT